MADDVNPEWREFHERWMLFRLGHKRRRPGYLINPDIPEQSVAKLLYEINTGPTWPMT